MQCPRQVLITLEQGGLVLCANARAARALTRLFNDHVQHTSRLTAWASPAIYDWHRWLELQWNQLLLTGTEDRMLLRPLQEEVLWAAIVRPDVEERSLIAPAEIAHLASRAYTLLHTHRATGRLRQAERWNDGTPEPELFRRWALEFDRQCSRRRWLAPAALPPVIEQALHSRLLPPPTSILWNGFDKLTPAGQAFRHTLDQAHCSQTDLRWNLAHSQHLLALPSFTDELEACAQWARSQLAAHPATRIGILLPDVNAARAEVDRLLNKGLSSASADISARPAYEFTLGLPLADVPVITAALSLLRWCVRPLESETITWLLLTGFLGDPEDASVLAEADLQVRRRLNVPELDMDDALRRLSRYPGEAASSGWTVQNWVKRLTRARNHLQPHQGRARSAPQWLVTIENLLEEAGWPGTGTLDSVAFQAIERWRTTLEEVATLSFHEERYDFPAFVSLLTTHLQASIFSPESLGAPITISGIPESAGQGFDAIWVLGATDDQWPPRSRQHPLLPSWLQLEHGMPGGASGGDLALGAATLERLQDSTPALHFSYSRESKEGAQRPSSLLRALPLQHLDPPGLPSPEILTASFEDHMAIPWPGNRPAGGVSVLKKQSACPFQAFAATRLNDRELPRTDPGLDPAARGTLLHDALEKIWQDPLLTPPDPNTLSSEALRASIANSTLDAIVERHVTAAFTRYRTTASSDWEREYLRLEQDRVCSLVKQWLHYEKARAPFRVEHHEKSESIKLNGLLLNVRMDRVDTTSHGRILIDYKTGKIDQEKWAGDRPDEPQLPIYAVSGSISDLRDVLFAQVRADGVKFISAVFNNKPDLFPIAPPDFVPAEVFASIRSAWQGVLLDLSQEFQDGLATVTPKDYPVTCKFCEFPALCRVAESKGQSSSEDDTP